MNEPAGKPAWARDLEPRGRYYEGFVEDLDSLLTKFKAETVTTFGVRKSRYLDGSNDRIREPADGQENTKVDDACITYYTNHMIQSSASTHIIIHL